MTMFVVLLIYFCSLWGIGIHTFVKQRQLSAKNNCQPTHPQSAVDQINKNTASLTKVINCHVR